MVMMKPIEKKKYATALELSKKTNPKHALPFVEQMWSAPTQ